MGCLVVFVPSLNLVSSISISFKLNRNLPMERKRVVGLSEDRTRNLVEYIQYLCFCSEFKTCDNTGNKLEQQSWRHISWIKIFGDVDKEVLYNLRKC